MSNSLQKFWWVNQGTNFAQESLGGYIWAPQRNRRGVELAHWNNMTKLTADDLVLHYGTGALRAVGRVVREAQDDIKPTGPGSHSWESEGRKADIEYYKLGQPIPLDTIPRELRINVHGSPFNRNGGVNQGYLYPLSDRFVSGFAKLFTDQLPEAVREDFEKGKQARSNAALQDSVGEPVQIEPQVRDYEEPNFEQIAERVKEAGLIIDEQTLRRYHLSLKTRKFVILSGVSGTGKTWLAKVYADAVGAVHRQVEVAPNWNANEDLLGYSSVIDGQYHDTEFSLFLRSAAAEYARARDYGYAVTPYHVVLDEMNLARVEYYFAKFLSLMELRMRGESAIVEMGKDDLELPPNLYFIGTVNIDETTHIFADKVYDRAQLVEIVASREALASALEGEPSESVIMGVWDAVHEVAPFAYRIIEEIKTYTAEAASLEVGWEQALDEQILQKVLPKLKGADVRVDQALARLELLDAEQFPLTVSKVRKMRHGYRENGFASYF